LSVITGLVYPLVVTGVSQVLFPVTANGSLLEHDGKVIGSALIGQAFSSPKYFWARPSATSPQPNNAAASSGSNLGPTAPALLDAVKERIEALRRADPDNKRPIPVDLVTASGSGLDPHISVAAARYQQLRVARERGIPEVGVVELVDRHSEGAFLGILGEARVNVLKINLALDALR
jgi:K+-transporting ATPase ATPase C chain